MRRRFIASTLLALAITMMPPTRPAAAAPAAPARPPRSRVAALCDEYWQGHLQAHPTYATSIGDRRFDALLPDNGPEARERELIRLSSVLDRARAFNPLDLSAEDQLNRAVLLEAAENERLQLTCSFHDWVVDAINGPQTEFNNLPDLTRIDTPADGQRYVLRLKAMPGYYDRVVYNLQRGLQRRRVAPRAAVERVIAMLDQQIAMKVRDWPLYRPVLADHSSWPSNDKIAFDRGVERTLQDELEPALARYRAFLFSSVLPYARTGDKAGIVNLPGGVEAYRMSVRIHTSLTLSPDEIHTIGLQSVAAVRAEIGQLGMKVLGTDDISAIQARLRGDSAMHFSSAAQIEATARATLARARAAIPNWFGVLPRVECLVGVIDPLEAPNSYLGYYREAASDGSRPAYYMVNTYQPTTRTRYEAEALAFHESIPGHHLQIAIASQLTNLPEFRRYLGMSAYVEGWALYTERLADEMKLYSGDLDRLGMLSFDAWRSCRLVVDTGLHAKGWSRAQAIDYMRDNTLLALNNIENEVDRYINWPGQALAYKLGQIEILRLRTEAQSKLGDRFDIRSFHDAMLRDGAVPLSVLGDQIDMWTSRQNAQ